MRLKKIYEWTVNKDEMTNDTQNVNRLELRMH